MQHEIAQAHRSEQDVDATAGERHPAGPLSEGIKRLEVTDHPRDLRRDEQGQRLVEVAARGVLTPNEFAQAWNTTHHQQPQAA